MLRIREEQQQVFTDPALEAFKERMRLHLAKFFPDQCASLGDSGTLEMIQFGIDSASSYELFAERDVYLFIDLMFCLGRDFDTNPRIPWVQDILVSDEIPKPSDRIIALHDEVQQRLKNPES